MASNLITAQLKHLPASPGVYIMRDTAGAILYVGKATSLRQRVRSYFATQDKLSPKIRKMVSRVNDFEFFITNSEPEALILELNLIKQYRPPYNVRLKDDKTFPYLKISLNETWPRVYATRRMEEDGSRYFGPFANAGSLRQTLRVLKRIFPFRYCGKDITGSDSRPCLYYHVGQCLAPCVGAITPQEYREMINQIVLFLEGKQESIVNKLDQEMKQAAEVLDFEKAALVRDRIQALHEVVAAQRIAATTKGEQDVIAFAQDKDQACVQVFFIRSGRLIGRECFVMQGTRDETASQIMTSFIKQFYNSAQNIPPLLLVQHPIDDVNTIVDWLTSKRGSKVCLQVPQRGTKKELVDTVAANARQGLEQLKIKQLVTAPAPATALGEIQKELKLTQIPTRIEGYDISNIQGQQAVGGMVVFEQGKPKPSHYRRFRIKTVTGANDYAMLQEMLKRRFKRVSQETDGDWATMPDLILIDGGKGQLNAALASVREAGIKNIPIVSLAKENEEIYLPEEPAPIILPHSSPGLQLLQRLRDEAHRFAIGYHQKVHKKATFASALDDISGIGPKRKRALLQRFGSVQDIREAEVEELVSKGNITRSLAQKIKEQL